MTPESMKERVMGMLRDHFRPEFLNGVDEIVMFQALGKKELMRIVDLQLADVVARLRTNNKIGVEFTYKAKALVAEKGYDPAFGARPPKRAIQDLILDELALRVVEG